ncbi:hypothetical protein Tco_1116874 [Tanacetum coccineum]
MSLKPCNVVVSSDFEENAAKENHDPMTDAAIKALIAQSVVDALAEHEANKSNENGNESHNSGSGGRRTEHTTREQAKNKRKLENNSSHNNTQQLPFKRKNVARAYYVGPSGKMENAGTLPLCNKCKFYHNGPCTRTLTCYEYGNQKHYRSDCPVLKNQNHENQAGGTKARRMVYALGGGEKDQDPNNMEDKINP